MRRLFPDQVDLAAEYLRSGALIAFPTETVYGLGAPVFQPRAIAQIFKVKGRPAENPLIAHVGRWGQWEQIAVEIPPSFYRLAEAFFPGPLTVILRRHPDVTPLVSGGLETIALRMPAHPLARQLIDLVGEPIVAPSANLSGRPSATCAEHVIEDFAGKISAVLDGGPTELGIESTVVRLEPYPLILRPGTITAEQIGEVLQCSVALAVKGEEGGSPGAKHRHYAPRTPVVLFSRWEEMFPVSADTFILGPERPPFSVGAYHLLSAQHLYASLRAADQGHYKAIFILCDERIKDSPALYNRILHCAGKY